MAQANAGKALAVVIAGAGTTTEKETFDLLEDAIGAGAGYDEVAIVVPVNKSLLTDAVENALIWWDDDDTVIAVTVDGENMSRRGAAIGSEPNEKVAKFEDIFLDEFDGFDERHFYVALPDEDEDVEGYNEAVGWIEAAQANGFVIKNLCAGLDDVVLLEDEPEPEAVEEPTAEEPKRSRRGRSRAKAVEEEDTEDAERAAVGDPVDEEPEEAPKRSRKAKVDPEPEEEPKKYKGDTVVGGDEDREGLQHVFRFLNDAVEYFDAQAVVNSHWYSGDGAKRLEEAPIRVNALKSRALLAGILGRGVAVVASESSEPAAAPAAAKEDAEEAPSRGRGRPRTNFEVKEIFDEDANEWIPRPRGRIARGTEWRVRHDETDEILDEGTV